MITQKVVNFIDNYIPFNAKFIDLTWFNHYDETINSLDDSIIFAIDVADPPYFLSNDGITCHSGRMVNVNKGEWDKSKGVEENFKFNLEWMTKCQKLLKDDGTLWVSGTFHIIYSIGYAAQILDMKFLNNIIWQKPNPPPNLSCRFFTHSTETV